MNELKLKVGRNRSQSQTPKDSWFTFLPDEVYGGGYSTTLSHTYEQKPKVQFGEEKREYFGIEG